MGITMSLILQLLTLIWVLGIGASGGFHTSHQEGKIDSWEKTLQTRGLYARNDFSLGHVFFHEFSGSDRPPRLHTASLPANKALEITSKAEHNTADSMTVHSRPILISRRRQQPTSIREQTIDTRFFESHEEHIYRDIWETTEIPGPDVGDKATVVDLAKMTNDAYVPAPSRPDWLNTSLGFNHSDIFGWKRDGLRGHVFTDRKNETVIVAFKGTSIDPRDRWRNNDRLNDNLLFSCCCAEQRRDPYWYGSVCDCRADVFQCNSTCLSQELIQKDRYYLAALAVVQNVSLWYPNSNLWVVGHSLGGAVAGLMGLTFNIPSVAFESPPDKLAAQRLGLLVPPYTGAFHIGNTADPVYMGACNGYFSSCSVAGYAFESQCHIGVRCVYDTVGDKGWHLNINNHRLSVVIPDVLEAYNNTPTCEADDECFDCFNWSFGK